MNVGCYEFKGSFVVELGARQTTTSKSTLPPSPPESLPDLPKWQARQQRFRQDWKTGRLPEPSHIFSPPYTLGSWTLSIFTTILTHRYHIRHTLRPRTLTVTLRNYSPNANMSTCWSPPLREISKILDKLHTDRDGKQRNFSAGVIRQSRRCLAFTIMYGKSSYSPSIPVPKCPRTTE